MSSQDFEADLTHYEEERLACIDRNNKELIKLGLASDPADLLNLPSPVPRVYTKTADKVMPRDKSTRVSVPPKRYEEEFGGLDIENLAEELLMDSGNSQFCFCGNAEDDDSDSYIICIKCKRFCHLNCTGLEIDESQTSLPKYTCPDCKIEKILLPKKIGNTEKPKIMVAAAKHLATTSLSIVNGVVNLSISASPDMPRAHLIDKALVEKVTEAVKVANTYIQPRLDFQQLGIDQVTCINFPCDGTINRLGGGTMTPRGQKLRYECRLCNQKWQQLLPSKCSDGNYEITTRVYAAKDGSAKNKRKCDQNFCKTCKVPKKGHKCLPMPTGMPSDDTILEDFDDDMRVEEELAPIGLVDW